MESNLPPLPTYWREEMMDTESKKYIDALVRLAYHQDAVYAGVMAKIPIEDITEENYLGMYKHKAEFAYMYAGENGMLTDLHETVKSCIDWYMYWDTYLDKDYVWADGFVFKKLGEKK
jgi:hypothetical protein